MSTSMASPPPASLSIMKIMLDDPIPSPLPPLKPRDRRRSRSKSPIKVNVPSDSDDDKTDSLPKRDDFYRTWDIFRSQIGYKSSSKISNNLDSEARKCLGQSCVSVPVQMSYEAAAAKCKAKVNSIIQESRRLNRKYRDRGFDFTLSNDALVSLNPFKVPYSIIEPGSVGDFKRIEEIFDNPKFSPSGNVRQGATGDCWLLAAVTALAGTGHTEDAESLLSKLCVAYDEAVGVYGFVFFKDGEWIYEIIDDKLALKSRDDRKTYLATVRYGEQDGKRYKEIAMEETPKKIRDSLRKGRDALYFSSSTTEDYDESWLPLFEKAFAKAHGDYQALDSGCPGEGIEDLTGGVNSALRAEDILDKNKLWDELLKVNKSFLFGCSSMKSSEDGPSTDEGGLIKGHAYAVLAAKEIEVKSKTGEQEKIRLVKLRNPWGRTEFNGPWSDGSKEWTPFILSEVGHVFGDDGIFWISYKDFLQHLPYIDRTRLFTDEWFVTSRWTCVTGQFWPQYSDTTFLIEVKAPGPVVLVLSTPDNRYFRGLEGRYRFWAHFKVYRDGEEDYLVRSVFRSGSTRSCSAELNLEPGRYRVRFRLGSQRNSDTLTREEVIRRQGLYRPEKLLNTVKRFESVHKKAGLRELEVALLERKKQEGRKKAMDKKLRDKKAARQHNQKEKRRMLLRMRRRKDEISKREKEKRKSTSKEGKSKKSDHLHEPVVLTPTTTTTMFSDRGSNDGSTVAPLPERCASAKSAHNAISKPAEETPIINTNSQQSVDSNILDTAAEQAALKGVLSCRCENGTGHHPKIEILNGEPGCTGTHKATKLSPDVELNVAPGMVTVIAQTNEPATSAVASPQRIVQKNSNSVSAAGDHNSGDESDSTLSRVESVADDDFAFDSDIDGPPSSRESSDNEQECLENELFEGDAWNAICAVGLRVYSLHEGTTISIEGEDWRT